MNLQQYRLKIDRLSTQHGHATERVKEERGALQAAQQRIADVAEAQRIVQIVAQKIQKVAHRRITSVVTRCLLSVFGENAYRFKIHFERKRGKTEARCVFIREEHEVKPSSGSGGGVQDVAAFACRLAAIMLAQPQRRRLIVVDEAFKAVHSPIYRERVRIMLDTLAAEMGVQFIQATGVTEYETGEIITID